MTLRGCGTALVTPFKADGSLDDAALRSLVAWQVDSGIDFLVPCGTTGETPTLSHDEWLQVIDTTIEVAAGRVPIVAGGNPNTEAGAGPEGWGGDGRAGGEYNLSADRLYNTEAPQEQMREFWR